MGSFSGLGIGLSFVFGCILMGLVAELYYLLWWKKKIANSNSTTTPTPTPTTKQFQEFNLLFCWKRPKSCNATQELTTPSKSHQETQDLEIGVANKELGLKHEEGIEAELMRLHNLHGPPRFLFTIKEESKEDLESDDGRSRKGSRTRSLSDLIIAVDGTTPFLTPLSSPTLKAPNSSLDSYSHHGINPLFEEAELGRLRSSPPPKFKFLRDAEEKLVRRLIQEEAERKMREFQDLKLDEKCGSFVKFLGVREQIHNQATQVLPLASSPTFQRSG